MLKLDRICKTYRTSDVETAALDEISLDVRAGEFLSIMGPSGCGKSTLLNVLGLIDSPTSGAYWFMGEDVARCSEEALTLRRRSRVGFVFQSFNLIDDLNVAENVDVALLYLGMPRAERRSRVSEALERVGLKHREYHSPKQLSGGQQQRVAVARALVTRPKLLLADEPTGNLDSANGNAVLDLLDAINRAGTTIVMVTHSAEHANRARRIVHMLDGRVVEDQEIAVAC